jgi:hypothetical protein
MWLLLTKIYQLYFYLFLSIVIVEALPHNFTHRLELTIAVDGKIRGTLGIGLYAGNASKAAHNFLA